MTTKELKKEILEEFDKEFVPIEAGYVGINAFGKYALATSASTGLRAFLSYALSRIQEQTREETAKKIFKELDDMDAECPLCNGRWKLKAFAYYLRDLVRIRAKYTGDKEE